MSFSFALRDMYHHRKQMKAYWRSSILVIFLSTIFLNLINSLGFLLIPSHVELYNLTIYEMFGEYNRFVIIFTALFAIVVILMNNHAVILSRKHDLAVMKAVGTYPRQLYSFYLVELLLLVSFSFIIGWVLNLIALYFITLIITARSIFIYWAPDFTFTGFFFLALLLVTFLINGYEIRRIGLQTYSKAKSGLFPENYSAQISSFWQKQFSKFWLPVKIGLKNVIRKKKFFRQQVTLITFAGLVIFIGLIGNFIITNSERQFIMQAQGEHILAIGHSQITDSLERGYRKFSDPSIINLENTLHSDTLLDLKYNLTSIESTLPTVLFPYGLSTWDRRIYTIEYVTEKPAVVLQTNYNMSSGQEYTNYTLLGKNNESRWVAMQGIELNLTVQQWYSVGSMELLENGVAIGDTLAGELFENAYLEYIAYSNIETNRTYRHKIYAVFFDTLYNGNSFYIPLAKLQQNLNRTNYLNLFLVNYSTIAYDIVKVQNLKSALTDYLHEELGSEFQVVDLSSNYEQNLNLIMQQQTITLFFCSLVAISALFIFALFQWSGKAEDLRDYSIITALGIKPRHIRQAVFWEMGFMVVPGLLIAFVGAINFLIFFLLEDARFPSFWLPVAVFGACLGLFLGICILIARILSKGYYTLSAINQFT